MVHYWTYANMKLPLLLYTCIASYVASLQFKRFLSQKPAKVGGSPRIPTDYGPVTEIFATRT